MTKKICISGYYGFDNFGDETILKVLVENLKNIDSEITVFSSNPTKTANELNVKSIYSFDCFGLLKSLFKTDYLISGGGSLLQDVTSTKSLIYYLGVLFLAQILGKKIIIFAQGIGPINNKFLAKLTALILKKSKFVSVRDENSFKLLNSWNVSSVKCDDPVWNINIEPRKIEGKIAIQLRSFSALTDEFISKLAECINKYYSNKEINILSLQNKLDLTPCNKLKDKLLNINNNLKVQVIENTSNDKLIEDIINSEELIAMRYHACLVGIKAGIRVIPINYDVKVETLAKEFSLESILLDDIQSIPRAIENNKKHNNKIESKLFDFERLNSLISAE